MSADALRIAVVGPGSVGVFFAAHLAAAGHHVTACARRPFDRYVVESDRAAVSGPAKVVTDPAALDGPADVVIVAVKCHQTASTAPWLQALCAPGTIVIAAQNGVEGAERLAPLCGPATVLPSVVYCGAELLEPGHIRHYSAGSIWLPDRPSAHRIVDAIAASECTAQFVARTDFATEQWRKLGTNVVFNGVTALTRKTMHALRHPSIAPIARLMFDECWTVGRAEGADLGNADTERLLGVMAAMRDGGATSMYYDTIAGRPTEHDAIHGAVLRIGARHGISAERVRQLEREALAKLRRFADPDLAA